MAVAMTTAINLTVLLHSTQNKCLYKMLSCSLYPAHLHHFSLQAILSGGFPQIYTQGPTWVFEHHYIQEIHFVMTIVSLCFCVMKML